MIYVEKLKVKEKKNIFLLKFVRKKNCIKYKPVLFDSVIFKVIIFYYINTFFKYNYSNGE